jgi:hypothetical protein
VASDLVVEIGPKRRSRSRKARRFAWRCAAVRRAAMPREADRGNRARARCRREAGRSRRMALARGQARVRRSNELVWGSGHPERQSPRREWFWQGKPAQVARSQLKGVRHRRNVTGAACRDRIRLRGSRRSRASQAARGGLQPCTTPCGAPGCGKRPHREANSGLCRSRIGHFERARPQPTRSFPVTTGSTGLCCSRSSSGPRPTSRRRLQQRHPRST